jgi:hypothetical protein
MVDNKVTRGRPQRGEGHLDQQAQVSDLTVIELVKQAIRTEKSLRGAARLLGVTPNTVRYYLKQARITFRVIKTVEFIPLEGDSKNG